MRMDDQRESENVEDVRGSSGGFRPVHGIGLGTIVIALIGGWIFGINPLQILGLLSGGTSSVQAPATDEPGQPRPRVTPKRSSYLRSSEARNRCGPRYSRSAAPCTKIRSYGCSAEPLKRRVAWAKLPLARSTARRTAKSTWT